MTNNSFIFSLSFFLRILKNNLQCWKSCIKIEISIRALLAISNPSFITQAPRNNFSILPWPQGFQKGIIQEGFSDETLKKKFCPAKVAFCNSVGWSNWGSSVENHHRVWNFFPVPPLINPLTATVAKLRQYLYFPKRYSKNELFTERAFWKILNF